MTPSQTDQPLSTLCWTTTAILGIFLCLLQLGTMLSLLAARTGFRLVAPIALIASLLAGLWLSRREQQPRPWQPLALALVIVAVSLAISAFYYDLSWDGQWYHQTAILHIARDWNPLADPMHPFASNLKAWVRHYPKGPWYAAAAIYRTTGHIEFGKAPQGIALAAMFLSALAFLLDLGLRRLPALALAVLIALNPVATSQLTGFMVDGIMLAFLTVAIAATLSAIRSSAASAPRASTIAAATTTAIITINAKFTGLVFLCIALVAMALWCALSHRTQLKRFTLATSATLVLAVCLFGYNPYITNTIAVHQPLYPVLGNAKYPPIDHIERGETPRNLQGRNRLFRFAFALFGRPGNQPYFVGKNATLMAPFAARPADLYAYTYQETRVGGFGPWFSGCLLLAIALAAWLLLTRTPHRWQLALIAATILASLLINKHLWWPRYGPQLWWLPILPLIGALQSPSSEHSSEHSPQHRPQRAFAWTILGILLLNALIVAGVRVHWETTRSLTLRHQLRDMHDSGKTYRVSTRSFTDSATTRLNEAGVPFQDLGMTKLPTGHELTSVVEYYPDATRYLANDEKP